MDLLVKNMEADLPVNQIKWRFSIENLKGGGYRVSATPLFVVGLSRKRYIKFHKTNIWETRWNVILKHLWKVVSVCQAIQVLLFFP